MAQWCWNFIPILRIDISIFTLYACIFIYRYIYIHRFRYMIYSIHNACPLEHLHCCIEGSPYFPTRFARCEFKVSGRTLTFKKLYKDCRDGNGWNDLISVMYDWFCCYQVIVLVGNEIRFRKVSTTEFFAHQKTNGFFCGSRHPGMRRFP